MSVDAPFYRSHIAERLEAKFPHLSIGPDKRRRARNCSSSWIAAKPEVAM
jgi:hypothetical protein